MILRQRPSRLVVVTLAASLLFTALAAPAMSGRPFELDEHVKTLAARAQHPLLDAGMETVTLLGEAAGLIPLIALLSCAAWRLDRRYALAVPAAMLGAGVLQLLAKRAIARPRPNLDPWGFPSGHVLSLVVLLGLLCYLMIAVAGVRRRWACVVATGSAATLAAVAASRVYLDAHWFSDVVGGFAIGLAYLLAVIGLVSRPTCRRPSGSTAA